MYDQWIHSELESYWKQFASQITFHEYQRTCCFLLTMTFDRKQVQNSSARRGLPAASSAIETQDFKRMYVDVCKQLARRSTSSPPVPNPFAFAVTDYEGSKFGGYKAPQPNNLHYHSFWALPPGLAPKFQLIVLGIKMRLNFRPHLHADHIQVKRYDPSKNASLADYTGKAWIKSMISPSAMIQPMIFRGDEELSSISSGKQTQVSVHKGRLALKSGEAANAVTDAWGEKEPDDDDAATSRKPSSVVIQNP